MESVKQSELVYELEDKPPFFESLLAAIQHLLASFVGIITPTLIIGIILGLETEIHYLISMSLIASGIGTFIQASQPFGIGAGMLCVQGTSFTFLGAILSAGFLAKNAGGGPNEILGLIITLCFFGSFIQIGLSQILPRIKHVITPLVTGIIITSIGTSLIKVGMTDIAGGMGAENFGSRDNFILGLSFKPGTDDIRESQSIDVINSLLNYGAKISAFDPVAMTEAQKVFNDILVVENNHNYTLT